MWRQRQSAMWMCRRRKCDTGMLVKPLTYLEAEDVAHQHVHALRVRIEGGALHDHQARSADVVKIHRPVEPVVGEVRALRALRNRGARVRGPVDAAKLPAVL